MTVSYNHQQFESYLDQAKGAYGSGDYSRAAAFAQIAAGYAWHRHSGFFYSAELEELVGAISAHAMPDSVRWRKGRDGPRRVLHVLTQVYPFGGHTRLVRNWIETDKSSEHHVALTQQGSLASPPWLGAAARNSGGTFRHLDQSGGLLRIAGRLQRMASEADFIVLSVHPDDVVPSLAFQNAVNAPPIAHLNHADHAFWLGSQICDVVLNLRRSGEGLAIARRGLPALRNMILPVPLPATGGIGLSRTAARRQLSINDDEVLILTVASQHKFQTFEDVNFAEIHFSVLEQRPNVRFLVVGPTSSDSYWRHWEQVSNGQLRAVGTHPDTDRFLAAADIYCDSFPIGSMTSLLEAGLAGLPCVSWRPLESRSASAATLSSDNCASDDLQVGYVDKTRYLDRLQVLIDEPNRAEFGARLSESLTRAHTSDGWLAQVDEAYLRGRALSGERPHRLLNAVQPVDAYDEILANIQESQGEFEEFLSRSLPLDIRLQSLSRRRANVSTFIGAALPNFVVRRFKALRSGL